MKLSENNIIIAIGFVGLAFCLGIIVGEVDAAKKYDKKLAEEVEQEVHHIRQMAEKKNDEPKTSVEWLDNDEMDEPEIEDIDEGPDDEIPLQYLISKAEYEDDSTEERDYDKIDLFYEEETDTVVDGDGVECEQYDIVKEIMDSENCYVRDDFNMTDYHVQPLVIRSENNAESES